MSININISYNRIENSILLPKVIYLTYKTCFLRGTNSNILSNPFGCFSCQNGSNSFFVTKAATLNTLINRVITQDCVICD